jgi:formamidopyrimidine-DNA glycosylase
VPEILEVESARALIGARALHRPIAKVHAPDAWFLKRGLTPRAVRTALTGTELVAARRRGKLMLVDFVPAGARADGDVGAGSVPEGRAGSVPERPTGSVPERRAGSVPERPTGVMPERLTGVLGLHLGMSGRVLIDGEAAGDPLLYASNRPESAWHRFGLSFADGGSLYLRDPRRLGAVELDPDEDRLGPDAFDVTLPELRAMSATSRAPVKAMLMDQSRIAGLGNLLCDEALWRAGIDPARTAGGLDADETRRLHRAIRDTLRILGRRGGSHTGDLTSQRELGAPCPKDGATLLRRTVGGRTTYSCPLHQR